jgi:hypothetical protein
MAAALIVALAMLPTRMRAEQNDTDDTSPDDHSPSRRDGTQRANTFDTLVDENAR